MSEEIEWEEEEEDSKRIEYYLKAGKVGGEARKKAASLVKPGKKLFEVAEEVEQWILEQGCGWSFPVNISINNQAAHYTPELNDETVFGEKDVVKVDVGTHYNGYIGDNAETVDLSGENGKLVEASSQALENALSKVKAGAKSNEISREIENTIKSYGFKPEENLGGHMLEQYELHAGYYIPNVESRSDSWELEEGEAIAIEPFATNGRGHVSEGSYTQIFSYEGEVLTRNKIARELLKKISDDYPSMPFAERWLAKEYKNNLFQFKLAMRELLKLGAIKGYSVLQDEKGALVAQTERTIIVEKDSCKITTP